MNGVEMLRQQFEGAAQVLGATLNDCPAEIVNAKPAGTANSIAASVAHLVFGLDRMVNVSRGATTYESAGFASRIGLEMPAGPFMNEEWAKGVKLDLASFQEYTNAVFAATDEYLQSLSDADLDREVEFVPGQKTTVGRLLGRIGVFHLGFHIGEASAIKGVQNLKGIPF